MVFGVDDHEPQRLRVGQTAEQRVTNDGPLRNRAGLCDDSCQHPLQRGQSCAQLLTAGLNSLHPLGRLSPSARNPPDGQHGPADEVESPRLRGRVRLVEHGEDRVRHFDGVVEVRGHTPGGVGHGLPRSLAGSLDRPAHARELLLEPVDAVHGGHGSRLP